MILRNNKIFILSFVVLLSIHPAPQEATGVNPWRNDKVFPKGNDLEATAVKPWSGVHFAGICYAGGASSFNGRVKSDNINVRSDSTINSEIICTINKGEVVATVSELYEWYKIRLPKFAPSFIKKELVTPLDDKRAVVSKDHVNIRLRPNDSSSILGRIERNEVVQILKESRDWYKIEPTYNSFGWVHKKFINKLTEKDIEPEQKFKEEIVVAAEISPPDKNITIEGTIRPKTIKSIATHKLIGQDNKVFLIKSDKANLNAFNFHKVRITGKLTSITSLEYPIIEAIKIEDLK